MPLAFDVEAHDGVDLISRGTHQRAVIDAARFNANTQAKAAKPPRNEPDQRSMTETRPWRDCEQNLGVVDRAATSVWPYPARRCGHSAAA